MINDEVMTNRNKLISMMAVCEDITRTNNRIYDMLQTLMNNPSNRHNLNVSIEDLINKATKLQNTEIGEEFTDKEDVIVPTIDDASPKEDPEYEKLYKKVPGIEDITPEPEEEPEDVVEEEAPTPPAKRQRPLRKTRARKALRDLSEEEENTQEN